jgi:hypothetical protein
LEVQVDRKAPQGVGSDAHVDYWARAFAEELSPTDVKDQDIIRYIDACRSDERAIPALADKMIESDNFCRGWEYFSTRMSAAALLKLAEVLCDKHLRRSGAAANGDDETILSVWRRINRRVPRQPETAQWIKVRLRKALLRSLGFYNNLYYYWTGTHGIVDREDVQGIRDEMLMLARRRYTKKAPFNLLAVLSPEHPWALRHFVMPPDQRERLIAPAKPGDWAWLSPVLSLAIREDPFLVLPQLARLVSESKDVHIHEEMHMASVMQRIWTIDRDLATLIFGEQTTAFIQALAHAPFDSLDDPDLACLFSIRDAAQEWLDELDKRDKSA